TLGNRMITMFGQLATYLQGVDLRLQSHRWMNDLVIAGGRIVIENVDPDRLDDIAAQHDLVLVAAGRGALAELFPRNAERSVYSTPQRKLAMAIVTGLSQTVDDAPFLPVKFNLLAQHGEVFFLPYHHRDHGATWCIAWEAKAGGRMDRFEGCR